MHCAQKNLLYFGETCIASKNRYVILLLDTKSERFRPDTVHQGEEMMPQLV